MKEAFVYRTTNDITGKIYIGVRTYSFTYHDNTYIGSGKALKSAIKKYGKHSFTREKIFEGTQDECYELEKILVDTAFIERTDNYNICVGGIGGDRNCGKAISEAQKKIHKNRTHEEKQKLLEWLNSIRPEMITPTGKDHPKHVGMWHTPIGVFETTREAGLANNLDYSHIRKICKNPDKVMRYPERYGAPKNSTWRDCGFWLCSL